MYLLQVGIEEKKLPTKTIRERVKQMAKEFEAQQGNKPGRRARNEMAEKVKQEMLPKAPARLQEFTVVIDQANARLVIEAASRGKAERVVTFLRDSLGAEGTIESVETTDSVEATLTRWVTTGAGELGVTLGSKATLRDNNGGSVSYSGLALDGEDVRAQLKAGHKVTKLELVLESGTSAVMTTAFELKGAKWPEKEEGKGGEQQPQDLDADRVLMLANVAELLQRAFTAFGIANDAKERFDDSFDAASAELVRLQAEAAKRAQEAEAANDPAANGDNVADEPLKQAA